MPFLASIAFTNILYLAVKHTLIKLSVEVESINVNNNNGLETQRIYIYSPQRKANNSLPYG